MQPLPSTFPMSPRPPTVTSPPHMQPFTPTFPMSSRPPTATSTPTCSLSRPLSLYQ